MASKTDFIEFPANNFCTTIFSLGPPRSGKTYILLKVLKEWLKIGMFEKYILILPSYKNEADGSYDWLEQHENVFVYESFHEHIIKQLIEEQKENNELFKSKKITEKPRIFFCVDDATSQGKGLFSSDVMLAMATQNRHLNIHSWFLMHYAKGILQPKVRLNVNFIFLYPVQKKLLENAFGEFIYFPKDFDDFKSFKEYWDNTILPQEHGCLLINGKTKYSPWVSEWFTD